MISKITNLEGWVNFLEAFAPVAAGTSAQTSSELDTGADTDSILAKIRFGTPAANNTLGITSSLTSGGTFAANGITALAAGVTNEWVCIRVERMKERYIKLVGTRGTSTTIDIGFVYAYSSKSGLFAPASDWATNATFAGYITPVA